MKLLFTSRNVAEINLLRGWLEAEGIPCQTRNEFLSTTGLMLEYLPELYISNDENFEAAQKVLASYLEPSETELKDWICPRCGAANEAQFGACWKCDYLIDAPSN